MNTYIRKIPGMRNMVHAQIKPSDEILLVETLAVKVGPEIDEWLFNIISVPRGCSVNLAVFLFTLAIVLQTLHR